MHFHRSRRRSRRSHASTTSPNTAPNTVDLDRAAPAAPPSRPTAPMTAELAARIAASPFSALGLDPALVRALLDEGYEEPSPVQKEVVPLVLAGRDVLACAQTGTGKTAAFVLPILQGLAASPRAPGVTRPRALVVTPTRELASQIAERISVYGAHVGFQNRHVVLFGGVGQRPQEVALARGPEILVATPGRLIDLMNQGFVRLDAITHLVLDEADRMLDMGFVHDVRKIVAALPRARQTLLLSATMPPDIESLGRTMLVEPARVAIRPAVTTAERIDQSLVLVEKDKKRDKLVELLADAEIRRVLVFTRTKHGANRLCDHLGRAGIESAAIHGNKSQSARERALEAFRDGSTRVLVATDVAARGIDVEGVTHVINFELPNVPESYVHRIGRTGRAGAAGQAISFCDAEERAYLADIERLIKVRIPLFGGGSRAPEVQPSRPPQGSRPQQGSLEGSRPARRRSRSRADSSTRRA